MGSKFAYSSTIKICASRFSEFLKSIFCILLVVNVFSLQKAIKRWDEYGGWGKSSQPNFFNFWSIGCAMCSRALWRIGPFLLTNASCRYCSFQCISSICWAYFSDVMILPGFRKNSENQTTSTPPNSDHEHFWSKFGFGKCFEASSWSSHWASCRINNPPFVARYNLIEKWFVAVYSKRRRHFKATIFFHLQSAHEASLIQLFHLSNLFQMPRDCRMVDVEFFNNFSGSCKRISFYDSSQLVIVNFRWLKTTLIFKALASFGKLLEPPVHCVFVSSF